MQGLTVLTYNIRGEDVSKTAHPSFTLTDKYRAIGELVLSRRPHLVTLQEVLQGLPQTVQLLDLLRGAGYCLVGAASIDGGPYLCCVLAKENMHAERVEVSIPKQTPPVVAARIPLPLRCPPHLFNRWGEPPGGYLYFVGCHLPYGGTETFASNKRLWLLRKVVRQACPASARLVFAGDTNLRGKREDDGAAGMGLGLRDAFVEAGRPQDAALTFDTNNNHYHGKRTYRIVERFDRVYLRGALRATDMQLVGDGPVQLPGPCFYLSDHFGLLVNLQLLPGSQAAAAPAAMAPATP